MLLCYGAGAEGLTGIRILRELLTDGYKVTAGEGREAGAGCGYRGADMWVRTYIQLDDCGAQKGMMHLRKQGGFD